MEKKHTMEKKAHTWLSAIRFALNTWIGLTLVAHIHTFDKQLALVQYISYMP